MRNEWKSRCVGSRKFDFVHYALTHSLPFDDQHNHSCFVSQDLTNWEKIENIIDMEGFPWAKCAIWAPTIEEKDGNVCFLCIDRMDLDESGNNIPVTMTEEWEYDE